MRTRLLSAFLHSTMRIVKMIHSCCCFVVVVVVLFYSPPPHHSSRLLFHLLCPNRNSVSQRRIFRVNDCASTGFGSTSAGRYWTLLPTEDCNNCVLQSTTARKYRLYQYLIISEYSSTPRQPPASSSSSWNSSDKFM